MSQFDELPDGWKVCTLEEISKLATGKTPSTSKSEFWDGEIPFITPSQIHPSGYIISPERTVTNEGAQQARIIPPESILIVCIGSVGKIGLLDRNAVINQQLNALIPESNILPKYLYYWSKYHLQNWVIQNSVATVNAAILNKSRLGQAPAIVAPLNEQRRIVAKIEALTARSRAAREALGAIPELLDQFRQSVLAAAFRGDLTADWRAQNPDVEPAEVLLERIRVEKKFADSSLSRKPPTKPKDIEVPNWYIPESWEKVLSHDLLAFVTSGSRGWAKYYSDEGADFLRVGNLDRNSIQLDLSDIQKVNPPDGSEGTRTKVEMGDILISITADIGMIGLAVNLGEAYINQHVALARPVKGFSGEFLAWYLASHADGYQQFLKLQRGATKTGLGLDDIRSIWIPLPPLEEQKKIVKVINSYLDTINEIEKQYMSAQSHFDQLDRAILAKAFRGELVPQDPNDEPAAVLLDRIRAERAKSHTKGSKKPPAC